VRLPRPEDEVDVAQLVRAGQGDLAVGDGVGVGVELHEGIAVARQIPRLARRRERVRDDEGEGVIGAGRRHRVAFPPPPPGPRWAPAAEVPAIVSLPLSAVAATVTCRHHATPAGVGRM